MEMQVLNRLAAVLAAVIDDAEAVIEMVFLRQLCGDFENMRNDPAVFRRARRARP